MNRPSGMQRCPRPAKGDTGNRAEQIAICLVLALELGATYHKPEEGYRRRTPDWLVTLRDGRQVALEVTGKRTDWKYEDLDGIRVGGLSMCRANGDRKSLDETLRRKMKDNTNVVNSPAIARSGYVSSWMKPPDSSWMPYSGPSGQS